MNIIRYDTLASTNSEASRLATTLSHGDVVICRQQTAGRGQRGNSWEAEPGKNLTFSLFLKPEKLAASHSFMLSMAVSVGISEALNRILAPESVAIKWPNDIYVNDLKLAGILIENSLCGSYVSHSIVGIGLNVNQRLFLSDAPNPVSMAQVCGRDFELDTVLTRVCREILYAVDTFLPLERETVIEKYHSLLWRRSGIHEWREPSGEKFLASIVNVAPSGHLTLITPEATRKTYAFKEIFPVL